MRLLTVPLCFKNNVTKRLFIFDVCVFKISQVVSTKGISPLDISQATPALHLGVQGLTQCQNSHKSHPAESEYNVRLPEVKKDKHFYIRGQMDCISRFAVWPPLEIKTRKTRRGCHLISDDKPV